MYPEQKIPLQVAQIVIWSPYLFQNGKTSECICVSFISESLFSELTVMLLAVFSSPLRFHFPFHLTQNIAKIMCQGSSTRSFPSENWTSCTFIGLSAFFLLLQACSKESQSLTKIKANRSRCASGKSRCSCMFRTLELAPADALQQIHAVKSYVLQIIVLVKPVINMCSTLNICSLKKITWISQTEFVLFFLKKGNLKKTLLPCLILYAVRGLGWGWPPNSGQHSHREERPLHSWRLPWVEPDPQNQSNLEQHQSPVWDDQ